MGSLAACPALPARSPAWRATLGRQVDADASPFWAWGTIPRSPWPLLPRSREHGTPRRAGPPGRPGHRAAGVFGLKEPARRVRRLASGHDKQYREWIDQGRKLTRRLSEETGATVVYPEDRGEADLDCPRCG